MNDDTTLVTAALFGLVGFAASLTQRARRWAFEQVESADAAVSRMAAAAHDFGRYGVIVDVGGGPRRTAGRDPRSPSRACAAWCSTNQPWSLAPTPRGVEIVGGSFFESVPAGGDAYLLKSVLHHWQDEPAIEILRARRRAAGTTGTALLVIERQFALPAAKLSNLNRWTRDSTVGGFWTSSTTRVTRRPGAIGCRRKSSRS